MRVYLLCVLIVLRLLLAYVVDFGMLILFVGGWVLWVLVVWLVV